MPRTPQAHPARPAIPQPATIFDPVARALDVIGDRWTLVLVRQLLAGPRGFQELRQRTGIAPRVLSSRLQKLQDDGFVETVADGARSLYVASARGRSLEPIIAELAMWWVHHGIQDLDIDVGRFTETSPQSIFESLPFLLREENARGAHVVFEVRLTGEGGGVWTVSIEDGHCRVEPRFAEGADVRYTADARTWCGVALGLLDAREALKRRAMTKEGGRAALDHYFHQPSRPTRRSQASRPAPGREGSTEESR
jgi:DNA-binding HxlR family transcriptional regulator